MPIGGAQLAVTPGAGMPLVFGNALGTDRRIWAGRLSEARAVYFDYLGHGGMPCTAAYDIEALALALGDALMSSGVDRFVYCGVSMGGALGLALALAFPARVAGLVLCNSAAHFGAPEFWRTRMAQAGQQGMAAVSEATVARWLTPEDAVRHPEKVQALRRIFESTELAGYLAACQAVVAVDLREIKVPTLILAGTVDQATPAALSQALHAGISGSQYAELSAAHLGHWGAPEAFDLHVMRFIRQLT